MKKTKLTKEKKEDILQIKIVLIVVVFFLILISLYYFLVLHGGW